MHCAEIIQLLHNTDSSSESSSDNETTSSSSGSDSDSFLCDLNILSAVSKKTKRHFIETTVNKYTDDAFLAHFKMSRVLTITLIHEITAANILPTHIFGRKKISAKKAFLMTIWYLVHQETFRQLSERWDVSFSSAHRVVTKIFDYFIANAQNHIRWPHGDRARVSLLHFSGQVGIHGVIGAIGELHIPIKAIRKSYDVYINRDGYHSILLQAVVDHEELFTDIYCGQPGALTAPTILNKSPLYINASESHLFDDTVLIGNSNYPNLPWLVPPFEPGLSEDQRLFNTKHALARSVVDTAFNTLTSRFSRLTNFNNLSVAFIVKGITAACILHNICVRNKEQIVHTCQTEMVIDTEWGGEQFGLSDYFTERASEYEQLYFEKIEEKERKERRHFEKMELLRKRRQIEQEIFNHLNK